MIRPYKIWWEQVKKVADSYVKEDALNLEDNMIRNKMAVISEAIEDLLSIL